MLVDVIEMAVATGVMGVDALGATAASPSSGVVSEAMLVFELHSVES